ncbi:MAG: hypothetical protein WA177_20800 [Xanthobacteraceae bacterium]
MAFFAEARFALAICVFSLCNSARDQTAKPADWQVFAAAGRRAGFAKRMT